MPTEISVVVEADRTRHAQTLVQSADEQNLEVEEFNVVIVDRGLDEAGRRLIDRLAARRPNVCIVEPGDNWLDSLTGRYVLQTPSDQRLFPQALSRLANFARSNALDVVVGRTAQPGRAPSPGLAEDRVGLNWSDPEAHLPGTVRLIARDRLRPDSGLNEIETLNVRVGVLGSYPVLHSPEAPVPEGIEAMVTSAPTLHWDGGDIVFKVSGTVVVTEAADLRPLLQLRQLGTGLTFIVPGDGLLESSTDGGPASWNIEARLAPLSAAAGDPLPRGTWQVDACLVGPEVSLPPQPLPGATLPVGLLPGMVIVTTDEPRNILQIDIGTGRLPIVTGATADLASVTETAAGTLLRLKLPHLHVRTAEPLVGHIALRNLKLPATIETSGGTAVLSSYVSGLAGVYPISAQFGRTMAPIGLDLKVSGLGDMQVVTAAPPAPRHAAKPNAQKSKRAATATVKPKQRTKAARPSPEPRGLVARVRQGVPRSLEPLVRRLARRPAARAVYRRLTGLSKPWSAAR